MHADFLSVCGWLNRRQKEQGRIQKFTWITCLYDDSAIIGARIYYVVFSWDSYKDNIPEIFNLRHGGLGIVGGVAMAVLVLFLFAKAKKQSVLLMLDTMTMGLLIGQIMGRWGNFFNRELLEVIPTDHLLCRFR